MKIVEEVRLRDFEFWAGAIYRAERLSNDELDQIEEILEEIYPEGMSNVSLNDLFWFEEDFIAQSLGFDSFEDIVAR